MNQSVIALVLGGGKGTRLSPLTSHRSKPAVPIAGKYRLVDIPISNCLNSNINRIFVLTQYNSASLNTHIKNTFNFGVFSQGFVDILAADQNEQGGNWYEGTADAVRKTLRYLRNHEFKYILILSGDQLYQADFQQIVKFHEENIADISIASIPVNAKDATAFGLLKCDTEGRINSFIEKPSEDKLPDWVSPVSELQKTRGNHYLASMGIYLFSKNVLAKILEEDDGDDFGKELIPNAIANYRTFSYQYNGYWTDIGSIQSFFEANIALTDIVPKFNLFDSNTIFTRSRMLPPSKFGYVKISHAIIADGCIISAEIIERSVIGVRSRIGSGTTIKNTYVMGADFYQNIEEINTLHGNNIPLVGVGENCYIERAILDKSCSVGNNVIIKGSLALEDGEFPTHTIVDGIVVVKKYAIIPDGTVIG